MLEARLQSIEERAEKLLSENLTLLRKETDLIERFIRICEQNDGPLEEDGPGSLQDRDVEYKVSEDRAGILIFDRVARIREIIGGVEQRIQAVDKLSVELDGVQSDAIRTIESLTEENTLLKDKVQQLESELNDPKEAHRELTNDEPVLREMLEDPDHELESSNHEDPSDLALLNSQLEMLKTENEGATLKLRESEVNASELTSEIKRLRAENAMLVRDIGDMKHGIKQLLMSWHVESTDFSLEFEEKILGRLMDFQSQIDRLVQNCNILKDNYKYSVVKIDLERGRKEKNLEQKCQKLESENSRLCELETRLRLAQRNLEVTQGESNEKELKYNAEISDMKEKLRAVEEVREQLQKKLWSQESQLMKPRSVSGAELADLRDRLNELDLKFNDQSSKFFERLLECESDIKLMRVKLEHNREEKEKLVRDKSELEEEITWRACEKVEAINQLCLMIEYHREELGRTRRAVKRSWRL